MRLKGTKTPLDECSSLMYYEHYLDEAEADELLSFCIDRIAWTQSQIKIFGKQVTIPRLNAWYGDLPYSYSGTLFNASDFPAYLEKIKQRINKDTTLKLNSVLANLYRDGEDCMGWHSDDEKSLGTNPQIASLSLGAARKFVIRHRQDKSLKHSIDLKHGSLLLMLGNCQQDWQHALPRTKKVKAPRVNLTFRQSVPE